MIWLKLKLWWAKQQKMRIKKLRFEAFNKWCDLHQKAKSDHGRAACVTGYWDDRTKLDPKMLAVCLKIRLLELDLLERK